MNYQICKSCGLGNSPTAPSCLRCGFKFLPSTGPPLNQGAPPKTFDTLRGQTNNPNVPPEKGGSNLYLILGGIAALVLVGGLLIGAVVIGVLVYSSKTNVAKVENTDKTRTPYPVNSKPTPNGTKSDTTKTIFGDEELAAVFTLKKQVGNFTHLSTFPAASDPSKKTFQNSGGEASAMYSSKDKNSDVVYCIASYSSSELAQEEFKEFIEREKQNGAKMLADIIFDQKNQSINATYKIGVLTVLTFCTWKLETVTLCHRIGVPQGTAVLNFHNSWFNIK